MTTQDTTAQAAPGGPGVPIGGPRRAPAGAVRHWVGATTVVLGLAAAAIAARGDLRPNPDDLRAPIVVALVALVAIAVWYAVIVVRHRRRTAPAAIARGSDPRLPAWCLVGVATLAAVPVWRGVAREVDGGVPGRVLPAVGAALLLVAVGGLLLALGSRSTAGEPPRTVGSSPADERDDLRMLRCLIAAVLTLTFGAAAVFAVAVVVAGLPVDATSAPPLSSDEGVPNAPAPTGVAWTWERPDGAPLGSDDVVAATTGVAVSTGDGVAVLDGLTGEERWHHRRDGAVVTSLSASPSGRWVMAVFRPSGDDWTGVRVMAFDTATGDVGFDQLADGGVFASLNLPMTDHVLVGGDPQEGAYEAFSLSDGASMWTWEPPGGCVQRGSAQESTARSTVIVVLLCEASDDASDDGAAGELVVVGLSDTTGREAWRHTEAIAAPEVAGGVADDWRNGVEPDLRAAGDGSAVLVDWSSDGGDDAGVHQVLLDGDDGTVLLADDQLDFDVARVDDTGATGRAFTAPPRAHGRHTVEARQRQELAPTACDGADVADTAAGHLVEVCTTPVVSESSSVVVTVTAWDDGTPEAPFDLDLPVADPATEPFVDARIGVFPAATVVWSTTGDTLVGLG